MYLQESRKDIENINAKQIIKIKDSSVAKISFLMEKFKQKR